MSEMVMMDELGKKVEQDVENENAFCLYRVASTGLEIDATCVSEGLVRLCRADQSYVSKVNECVHRFFSRDFGTMYDESDGEHPPVELLYAKGYYETSHGPVYVCINGPLFLGNHFYPGGIVACMHWER